MNLRERLEDAAANLEQSASTLIGGEDSAKELLKTFVAENLKHYNDERNFPGLDRQSKLSPYLHFGMISPVEIIRAVESSKVSKACKGMSMWPTSPILIYHLDSFIEELLVRRELSFNFVWYEADIYDSVSSHIMSHFPIGSNLFSSSAFRTGRRSRWSGTRETSDLGSTALKISKEDIPMINAGMLHSSRWSTQERCMVFA